jgi:hypothetical protein
MAAVVTFRQVESPSQSSNQLRVMTLESQSRTVSGVTVRTGFTVTDCKPESGAVPSTSYAPWHRWTVYR